MVDRRKREKGQVWRCNQNQWSGPFYIRRGRYIIVDTAKSTLTVVEESTGNTLTISRKTLTTKDDYFQYEGETHLVERPYAAICSHCGNGDVITSFVKPTAFSCKWCGAATSMGL